jgi:signal transduction histidine kinase
VEVATGAAGDAFGLRLKVRVQDIPYPWMANLFEDALRKGRTVELEGTEAVVQQFVRNEERFYRPKAVPILDPGGEPAGVVLILHDVTQQRQLDEKKSGAVSAVSHQLKTPLTSIRMAIHLLLEEKVGGISPKQADLLVAVSEDAERLERIVDELLDIGRIASGKARMDLRPVPPIDLVSREMEASRPAARDGGVSLVVDLPATLPQVWVDPARVAHVFANLLSNALKYTPPGGKITLSARAEGEFVRFQVSDTGVGIPEKYHPRIFDQFFRMPDQGPGTGVGLGLAIVKDIVEAHGGTVGVESREGEGSAFHFTLRVADHGAMERRHT